MRQDFAKWLWRVAIAWGVVLLVVGASASFTIGASDSTVTLLAFGLLFVLPILASVAARWIPVIAGAALLSSIVVIVAFVCRSTADTLQTLKRPYLWLDLLFGAAFILLAGQLRRPRRSSTASSDG